MIWESAPWKDEVFRLLSDLRSLADIDTTESQFARDRALFYSAFVVRKLAECRKITDELAQTKIDVNFFKAIKQEATPIDRAYGWFEFDRDFEASPQGVAQQSLYQVAGEIVHSFALLWVWSDEPPAGKVTDVIVSSFNNQNRRAMSLKLDAWIIFLERISRDCIKEVEIKRDQETGELKKIVR